MNLSMLNVYGKLCERVLQGQKDSCIAALVDCELAKMWCRQVNGGSSSVAKYVMQCMLFVMST